jgi:hypothetical protein
MHSANGEILAEADVVLVHPGKELLENINISDDQWIDHLDQE